MISSQLFLHDMERPIRPCKESLHPSTCLPSILHTHTHTPILFEQTRLLVWPDLIYSIKSCQNEPILTETTGADQYIRVHLQMTCWLCECIAFSGAEWSWPRSATKGSSGANNYYQVYNGSSAYVCASNLILLWIRHRNVLVVASGARFAYMN